VSRRRWAASGGLITTTAAFALAILLMLLACEAYLRWARFGAPGIAQPFRYMAPKFRSTDCLREGPDGEVMWPDCRMYYKGVPLVTNSLGSNDRVVDESEPHYRVAVLGDSLTMAAGIEARRIYHARVEERIDAELGAPGFVELYNFGRGGRSTSEQLRDLRWALERLPLDAVIATVVFNDLFDNLVKGEACSPGDEALRISAAEGRFYELHAVGENPFSAGAALLESWTGLWAWNRAYDFFRAGALRMRGGGEARVRLAALEETGAALFRSCAATLSRVASEADLPLLWLDLWYRPHPHSERMRGELETLGEPVLSMADLYREFSDPRELEIYVGDHHPSDAVHALYAERLYAALEERGWLERIRSAHRVGGARRASGRALASPQPDPSPSGAAASASSPPERRAPTNPGGPLTSQ
jgi:hypothetical protein